MMKKSLLLLAILPVLALAGRAGAATFTFSGIGLLVPDGNPSGAVDVQPVSSDIGSIDSVLVTLTMTGSYNGDLYVTLRHGSGYSVLLNRPGKNGAGGGYDDDGLDVTFSDGAAADVHTYQSSVTPAPGSPLTGTWRPDGRITDPDAVTFGNPRTALLSSFNGLSASGDWTLFVADLNGGDTHTLQAWSITVTGTVVPEPATSLLAAASAAGLLLTFRRRGC